MSFETRMSYSEGSKSKYDNEDKDVNLESTTEDFFNGDSKTYTGGDDGGAVQEESVNESSNLKKSYLVTLKLPKYYSLYSKRSLSFDNENYRRKSAAEKEINSSRRQKQISEYNMLVLKEDRQRRYMMRYGHEADSCFPKDDLYKENVLSDTGNVNSKKRKRVSFEL